MDIDRLFVLACGYADDGKEFRLFLEGPNPKPSFDRDRPKKTNLFYLFAGEEADAIRQWLSTRKAWQILRVPPPFTKGRGIVAIRIARSWCSVPASPFFTFVSNHRIDGEDHRDELRREVSLLIGSVIENPVHPHEYADLTLLREVIESAPVNVELASFREVWQGQARSSDPAQPDGPSTDHDEANP
jgi:hypothetical protein